MDFNAFILIYGLGFRDDSIKFYLNDAWQISKV